MYVPKYYRSRTGRMSILAKINVSSVIFIFGARTGFGVAKHIEKTDFTLKGAHNRNLRRNNRMIFDFHLEPIQSNRNACEKNVPHNV